jgi:hypothetical protein
LLALLKRVSLWLKQPAFSVIRKVPKDAQNKTKQTGVGKIAYEKRSKIKEKFND